MVEIYSLNTDYLSDEKAFKLAFERLPENIQRKLGRILFREKQNLGVGAYTLLLHLLNVRDIKNPIIEIGSKPHIDGNPLYFNLSHSGSLAVCAISETETGVDVEKIRPVSLRPSRKFTEYEQESIKASFNPNLEFLKLWSLKESRVKCTGEGLRTHLDSFSPYHDDFFY